MVNPALHQELPRAERGSQEWPQSRLVLYPNLIQGSDEWLAQRCGMLTASTIGSLISARKLSAIDYTCPACDAPPSESCRSKVHADTTIKSLHAERADMARRHAAHTVLEVANNDTSRSLTALLVAERITGWTDPVFMSDDMFRGIEDEPRARDKYSEHYAAVTETGFMVREYPGFHLGYSPDGLVGADGLIEIKSRRPKIHVEHILAGRVPADNMAQCQAGLLVSGRSWLDYVSYAGGMPMWVTRVYPDRRWFNAILAAGKAFEDTAADMIRRYRAAVEGLPTTERELTEMSF
ncbi:YqaJ viral recombinase family protein [Nocardia thailandica]|uniref:YqaJ viral recombinase family protein n=1 Tax=Nocardia thailandica TaxID=257275 RepID=UPI0002DBC5FC|nr:YqaJ viral recombinase family protein [Nocardia thailandica]